MALEVYNPLIQILTYSHYLPAWYCTDSVGELFLDLVGLKGLMVFNIYSATSYHVLNNNKTWTCMIDSEFRDFKSEEK